MITAYSKKLLATALVALASLTAAVQAEPVVKRAEEVFAKWYEWQLIMPDKDLTTMTEHLDGEKLKQQYVASIGNLEQLTPLLDELTGSCINKDGFILRNPVADPIKEHFGKVYQLLQHDMPGFISFLRSSPMHTKAIADDEQYSNDSSKIIDKYTGLFQMLFAHKDTIEASKYLFTVANHFYEYCFEEKTFPTFERMMLNPQEQPLGRMLYAVTWYNLAGNGWKHWHENSLKALKAKADAGCTIKYIAGGSDLLQMFNAGVYNIKNIDPQLPSQPKYYANGWEFLIHGSGENGGIGDKVVVPLKTRTIIMERTGFTRTGETFKARLNTNEVVEIPRSITTWSITDEQGNKLGQYQLDRRFCTQRDFAPAEHEALLMSFNELYFISLPSFLNGWNIEPNQFPEDLNIIIKQLRKPVSREMIFNMRIASLLNATDFKFIALGTCIN